MIDLTSSKGKKDEAAKSEPMTHAMPKVTSTIADRIAQHKGSIVPPMSKYVPKRSLRAKSSSPSMRLATMKNDKVDFAAKVVPRLIPFAAEIGSLAEKEETTRLGSYEKSTKYVFGEAAEICALLKPDLLEDIDACAKLVNGVRGVICPSFFAKHMA
ncbi:hypothetical protein ACFX11_032978 [Malus domestica]